MRQGPDPGGDPTPVRDARAENLPALTAGYPHHVARSHATFDIGHTVVGTDDEVGFKQGCSHDVRWFQRVAGAVRRP